jgi:selenide, water dikinase
LVGHLHELAAASGVAAQLDAGAVPAIPGALALLEDADAVSGGSRRNRAWAETFATFDEDVPEPRRRLACDAMTSGGLLIALPPGRVDELSGAVVGRLVDGEPGRVTAGR